VEDENGRKTDCVYNSDYPDLAKQFLFYTEYLCRTKLDEIATTASTTTATTTSLITTKTEATATTSNTTTSNPVATQSSTTVAADSRPEYWYSIEAPNGIKTCVHNADYPEEYETSSTNSTSLFFSEAVCQTFIEATSITSSTEIGGPSNPKVMTPTLFVCTAITIPMITPIIPYDTLFYSTVKLNAAVPTTTAKNQLPPPQPLFPTILNIGTPK